MSELSFLLDLLINHKIGKGTKDVLLARIKEIEARAPIVPTYAPVAQLNPSIAAAPQAPSTLAAMARNGFVEEKAPAVIAHTPAAQAAMASRQAAINSALLGKPEPGATSPRKF